MASLWYCNVGHGRSEIADAVASQMRELETYSCFDPFTNPMAEAITKRVSDLSPIDHARVFLCGSGSESIDTAMKLARLAHVQAGHPERTLIISRMRGYHGTNYGGTTAQGLPPNKEGWGHSCPRSCKFLATTSKPSQASCQSGHMKSQPCYPSLFRAQAASGPLKRAICSRCGNSATSTVPSSSSTRSLQGSDVSENGSARSIMSHPRHHHICKSGDLRIPATRWSHRRARR